MGINFLANSVLFCSVNSSKGKPDIEDWIWHVYNVLVCVSIYAHKDFGI